MSIIGWRDSGGLRRLIFRNLTYYWRTNLPIIAGVAAAVAVLAGALLVGQSVRESLRSLLYERIGATEFAITADHFFSEKLETAFAAQNNSCPIIYVKGSVVHEQTGIRVHDVNVYGVDERFWKFHGVAETEFPEEHAAFVGHALARQLNVNVGDGLLLRVETQQAIPKEWLYGRRDSVGRTIRLNCRDILPENKLGQFALRPHQGNVYSIFVPLTRLQRDLRQFSRVNNILLAPRNPFGGAESIRDSLKKNCTLQDLGLRLRADPTMNAFSLESNRIMLDDSTTRAASQAALKLGIKTSALYTYLANAIRANGRAIPYSVITAADIGKGALSSIKELGSSSAPTVLPDPNESIWLTDWAWRDLGISKGDAVDVDYYLWQENGELVTRTAGFRLAGVVPTSGDVNNTLAPEIPGITESRSISAWDPPFPLDLGLIRRKDEDYWNRYRATPKAFITLARGQELWGNRFGKTTALRLSLPSSWDLTAIGDSFSKEILAGLDPQEAGLAINPVKEQGLIAARGSTDFGEYFVYFSFFLIAAAILLSVLFFRLMIEQRVREIGILRAEGFPIKVLRRIFLYEGLSMAVAGSLLGLLGAIAYGWFMVFGLRNWWVGAVGTQHLYLHSSWTDLSIGALSGMVISMGAMLWTLRDLRRNSPRSLLTGVLESIEIRSRRARTLRIAAMLALSAAILLLVSSALGAVSQLMGFFGTGFLLLVSILCSTALYLRRKHPNPVRGTGWPALFRLGLRNAMHRPGRSLLCASLIASATFIIVSMEAFRQGSQNESLAIKSGTGGYAFLAESDLPIIYDLNKAEGREAVGIPATQIPGIKNVDFTSFRERPGDDASCLNLYAPQEPKILGAPHMFIRAGRFSFQDSLASDPAQTHNPWLLLESPPDEAVIPAIADANTVQYILHLSVGSELTVRGDRGKPVRLRLVAALRDSIFQGVLLISESNFLRVFPERQGYRFFLLDVSKVRGSVPTQQLKKGLADWGFNIESSQDRLLAYHRVENTYLSTFQSLGTLGLILGTVGLAAVLLRNVLERRQELALLRAVGYRRHTLSGIILAENMVLIAWGLLSGTVCALLAIIPALHTRGASFPLAMTGLILTTVLAAGLVSSLFAVMAVYHAPLLAALRSE
jgi:putative ABC transport system permease protein